MDRTRRLRQAREGQKKKKARLQQVAEDEAAQLDQLVSRTLVKRLKLRKQHDFVPLNPVVFLKNFKLRFNRRILSQLKKQRLNLSPKWISDLLLRVLLNPW